METSEVTINDMIQMALRTVFYFIFLGSTLACSTKKEEPISYEGLKIKSKLIRAADTTWFLDNSLHKVFLFDVSIINQTDSLKSFWIMTKQREMNWAINNDDFIISPKDFTPGGNFPETKEVLPLDSLIFHFMLITSKEASVSDIRKLRFGFVYFDANKNNSKSEFDNWLESHNVAREYDAWIQGHNRSEYEILNWKKSHEYKTREDRRLIWEQ